MQRILAVILVSIAVSISARAEDGLSLGDLKWLVGSWAGSGPGVVFEEHWLAASGGTMIGTFRLAGDKGRPVLEYIMIVQEPDRVVMRFKHFNSDYTTWEREAPLDFT